MRYRVRPIIPGCRIGWTTVSEGFDIAEKSDQIVARPPRELPKKIGHRLKRLPVAEGSATRFAFIGEWH
jgi:hypothetical protein